MRKIKNSQGLTLVEVIVSLAIFGIISVGILSILTESLLITSRAGARSESVMNVSSEIEKKLADSSYTNNVVMEEKTTHQAVINYGNGTSNPMNGNLVTGKELNERGQEVEVTVFIPD